MNTFTTAQLDYLDSVHRRSREKHNCFRDKVLMEIDPGDMDKPREYHWTTTSMMNIVNNHNYIIKFRLYGWTNVPRAGAIKFLSNPKDIQKVLDRNPCDVKIFHVYEDDVEFEYPWHMQNSFFSQSELITRINHHLKKRNHELITL